MSLQPFELRRRTAVRMLAAMNEGITSAEQLWVEASVPWAKLPESVTRDTGDRVLAVGLGVSSPAAGDRQRPGEGALVATQVGLRALRRIRAEVGASSLDSLTDEDEAYRDEARLVAHACNVKAVAGNPELTLRLDGITRRLVGDGTAFLFDLAFVCVHHYPLIPLP